jgi:nucleotide-binding universal stress UspA family protein
LDFCWTSIDLSKRTEIAVKKILVPVDGSVHADRAVLFAVSLAKALGASLHILHICEEYSDADRAHAYYSKAELEKPAKERGESIVRKAKEKAVAEGISVTTEVGFGDIAPQIVKRADEVGADQIVMGTHGIGFLETIFMGSKACKILELSNLPVTFIK